MEDDGPPVSLYWAPATSASCWLSIRATGRTPRRATGLRSRPATATGGTTSAGCWHSSLGASVRPSRPTGRRSRSGTRGHGSASESCSPRSPVASARPSRPTSARSTPATPNGRHGQLTTAETCSPSRATWRARGRPSSARSTPAAPTPAPMGTQRSKVLYDARPEMVADATSHRPPTSPTSLAAPTPAAWKCRRQGPSGARAEMAREAPPPGLRSNRRPS